jgi:hypothetical protein
MVVSFGLFRQGEPELEAEAHKSAGYSAPR